MSIMGGILVGTVWANLLGRELLKQIGYFEGIYEAGRNLSSQEQRQLWRYVLRQRLLEAGFGGMLTMTPIAVPGYLLLSFGAGIAVALMITVFTLEKGWIGLGYWLGSVLPQGLCYLMVWVIFAAVVKEQEDLKKVRIWMLTAILVIGGSFLEVWVNPLLAGMIL